MTSRSAKALAAVALLSALVACGSDDPAGTAPTVTPPHSTNSTNSTSGGHGGMTANPPHDFAMAQQVTVRKSGGLKPVQETVVFAMGKPAPKGFTKDDVAAVLKAAADPELKTVPTPRDICCDQYLYRVTISYPDGTSTTFTAVLGVGNSTAVMHLLTLVA